MSDTKALVGEGAASSVVLADNLEVLRTLPGESIQLIYIDPPFNTGRRQQRQSLQTCLLYTSPSPRDS